MNSWRFSGSRDATARRKEGSNNALIYRRHRRRVVSLQGGDTRSQFYKQYVNDDAVTAISFMTLAELKQWAVMRNWGPAKRDELTGFVSDSFIVVDSTEALCEMWAEVRGLAQRAGRQIDVADAWIAATAMLYNAELVTHNANHFDFLPGLTIIAEA